MCYGEWFEINRLRLLKFSPVPTVQYDIHMGIRSLYNFLTLSSRIRRDLTYVLARLLACPTLRV